MSMRSIWPCLVLLLMSGLGGCNDPAQELGTPPPIEIGQSHAVVPLNRFGAARLLRAAVASLTPDGRINRLEASIETSSLERSDATRAVLIQMGVDPTHIRVRPLAGDMVVLTRDVAIVGACDGAMQPPGLHGVDNSLNSLGVCVQATNLAAMVDHPRDLAEPVPLDPADGAVTAQAIERWRAGQVKQLPRVNPSASDDGGDGGATGDTGTAQQGGTTQSAGVTGNPLLSSAPLTGTR